MSTYVVTFKSPKGKEISLEQILCSEIAVNSAHRERRYPGTVTRRYDSLPASFCEANDIDRLMTKLRNLPYMSIQDRDLGSEYRRFNIPKRSGGMREICAPTGHLYTDQIDLRNVLCDCSTPLYHTTSFAYNKGRSILHCVQRHQANKSRWFLKLDFSDFFGSTNKEFVMRQLACIYPFSELCKRPVGVEILSKALEICFLNNGLPQGTPISPMLTNIIMIPFDHEINRILHSRGFVYTRYADDIQISHKDKFNPGEVCNLIKIQLRQMNMPYQLKAEKTRFGSSSGRNWNLGLMLNGKNKITLGHKFHKQMKARIFSFLMDEKNGKPWTLKECERLAGQVAYFKSIEPQTVQFITTAISKKVGLSFAQTMKKRLNPRFARRLASSRLHGRINNHGRNIVNNDTFGAIPDPAVIIRQLDQDPLPWLPFD